MADSPATSSRATGRDAAQSSDGPAPAPAERIVAFQLRSVLAVIAAVVAAIVAVEMVLLAKTGLVLIVIAAFLALALGPAVAFFERLGLPRPWAVAAVYVTTALVCGAVGLLLITPLVHQVSELVDALPSVVADLTEGRGPLGFLETRYHIVERVREATNANGVLHDATSAFRALRGVAVTAVGVLLIAFLTLFMLLEGPRWHRRAVALVPERHRPVAERIGAGIERSVVGFVTGNVVASLLAGLVTAAILLIAGVPYVAPLSVFVALADLLPFVGPVLAALVVSGVAFTKGGGTALVVFALLAAYHLIEGHTLRPLIYGRAVALSPLSVLVSIVLCVEIAGVLGAIAAIPIAGTVDVIVRELLDRQ